MGVVPVYTFLRHSGKILDFHVKNLVTCHLAFAVEIRHPCALGDMDRHNHIRMGGKQVYIYIMHNAST